MTYASSSRRVDGFSVSKSISISSGLESFSDGSRDWIMCTTRPSLSPEHDTLGSSLPSHTNQRLLTYLILAVLHNLYSWEWKTTNEEEKTKIYTLTVTTLTSQWKNGGYTHTHTTILRLCGFCPGQPGWAGTRRNIHPLTLIVVINHPYLPPPSTTIHGIVPIQSYTYTYTYISYVTMEMLFKANLLTCIEKWKTAHEKKKLI